MGWIDKVSEVIKRLKESGKGEQEIEQIVHHAAEAATVTQNAPAASPDGQVNHHAGDAVDAFIYAVEALKGEATKYAELTDRQDRRKTNNWRRLHGLPMHRERAVRRSERNGKAAGKNRRTKDL